MSFIPELIIKDEVDEMLGRGADERQDQQSQPQCQPQLPLYAQTQTTQKQNWTANNLAARRAGGGAGAEVELNTQHSGANRELGQPTSASASSNVSIHLNDSQDDDVYIEEEFFIDDDDGHGREPYVLDLDDAEDEDDDEFEGEDSQEHEASASSNSPPRPRPTSTFIKRELPPIVVTNNFNADMTMNNFLGHDDDHDHDSAASASDDRTIENRNSKKNSTPILKRILQGLGGHSRVNGHVRRDRSGFRVHQGPPYLYPKNICTKCHKSFKFPYLLVAHSAKCGLPPVPPRRRVVRTYSCQTCPLVFTHSHDFRRHLSTHRANTLPALHTCLTCGKIVKGLGSLRAHQKVHLGATGARLHKCTICSKNFKTGSALKAHLRAHERFQTQTCQICAAEANPVVPEFRSAEEMREHNKLMHPNHNPTTSTAQPPPLFGPIPCELCGKLVRGASQMTQHLKTHSRTYPCPHGECVQLELIFDSAEALHAHRQEKHRPLSICNVCGEGVRGIREFQIHRKAHEVSNLATQQQQLSCKICDVEFESSEAKLAHGLKHREENYACSACPGSSFKGFSQLYNHTKMHRRAPLDHEFECGICKVKFRREEDLQGHEAEEHGGPPVQPKVYQCSVCSKILSGAGPLSQHMRTHEPPRSRGVVGRRPGPPETKECQECGKIFDYPSRLRAHLRKSHGIGIGVGDDSGSTEPKTCKICGKQVSGSSQLLQHMKSHNRKAHLCPVPDCGKSFRFECLLKAHAQVHERMKLKKVYTCAQEGCEEVKFTHSALHRLHVRRHLALDKHECDICGKILQGRSPLTQHRKSHFGVRSCIFCGRAFQYAHQLMKHLKSHEKPENDEDDEKTGSGTQREYTCPEPACVDAEVATFANRKDYKNHIQNCHGGSRPRPPPTTHPCPTCSKVFRFRCLLKRHEAKAHSPDSEAKEAKKGFSCTEPECGQSFYYAYELRAHVRRHSTPKKTFVCDICGKVLKGASPLVMHRKTHERNKNKCEICGRVLKGASQLKAHLGAHKRAEEAEAAAAAEGDDDNGDDKVNGEVEVKKHICDICGKELSGASPLTQHRKSHSTVHKCRTCGVVCLSADSLTEHRKVHRLSYTCKVEGCGAILLGVNALRDHKRVHLAEAYAKLTCKVCCLDFDTAEARDEHRREHEAANFACDVCAQTFKGMGALGAHKRMHSRVPTYECDECPPGTTSFLYAVDVAEHKKTHREQELGAVGGIYECSICSKVVSGPGQLIQHRKMHFRPTGSSSKCQICGKHVGSGLTAMAIHKRKHALECELCERRRFGSHVELRQHRASEHKDTQHTCAICGAPVVGVLPFMAHVKTHSPKLHQCTKEGCKKSFEFASLLKAHEKTKHGAGASVASASGDSASAPREKVKVKCEVCGKEVSGGGQLAQHKRIHEAAPTHTCLLCAKTFKFACLLLNHLKVHSKPERGPGAYKCEHEECAAAELSFTSAKKRRAHLRSVHGEGGPAPKQLKVLHPCEICGKIYRFASLLKIHSQRAHKTKTNANRVVGVGAAVNACSSIPDLDLDPDLSRKRSASAGLSSESRLPPKRPRVAEQNLFDSNGRRKNSGVPGSWRGLAHIRKETEQRSKVTDDMERMAKQLVCGNKVVKFKVKTVAAAMAAEAELVQVQVQGQQEGEGRRFVCRLCGNSRLKSQKELDVHEEAHGRILKVVIQII